MSMSADPFHRVGFCIGIPALFVSPVLHWSIRDPVYPFSSHSQGISLHACEHRGCSTRICLPLRLQFSATRCTNLMCNLPILRLNCFNSPGNMLLNDVQGSQGKLTTVKYGSSSLSSCRVYCCTDLSKRSSPSLMSLGFPTAPPTSRHAMLVFIHPA